MNTRTPEFDLLLAAAKIVTSPSDEDTIRRVLEGGINWTAFAKYGTRHKVAALAGQTLSRIAPDLIPEDILAAFGIIGEQNRSRNRDLFDELENFAEALDRKRIDAIAFGGPVLAMQAFGDLGLRSSNGLNILVRDSDRKTVKGILTELGCRQVVAPKRALNYTLALSSTPELSLQTSAGTSLAIHTGSRPESLARQVDYDSLWSRATCADCYGRSVFALAPQDALLLLAITGSDVMWPDLQEICDIAALFSRYPNVDWPSSVRQKDTQTMRRALQLAILLVQNHFNRRVPIKIQLSIEEQANINAIVMRISTDWVSQAARNHATRACDRAWVFAKLGSAPPVELNPTSLAERDVALASDLSGAGDDRYPNAVRVARLEVAENATRGAAWRRLARASLEAKRYDDAIAAYEKALELAPRSMDLWKQRKAAFAALGRKAPLPARAIAPKDAASWALRAGALWFSARLQEAAEASDRALECDHANSDAAQLGIECRMLACDWRQRELDKRRMREGLTRNSLLVGDYGGLCATLDELALCAKVMASSIAIPSKPLWQGERYRHDRIRIAYLSSDFRDHVVAAAIVGCLECHDKSRFETTGISLAAPDGSDLQNRIAKALDHFVVVDSVDDAAVAKMLRELEIDIAIDLNGFSGQMRPGILAWRPAPVHVNFLGYSGTMAVPFIDYIIADQVVIPKDHQVHYREKAAYLPNTYMPTDAKRGIAPNTPRRIDARLPDEGFVFACFNNPYKITPEMFRVWMRLLRVVDGSVLWLPALIKDATVNLRHEAAARDIAPERLIFAPRLARAEDHLARLRLADLALDTLPYNGHGTTADAVWAGLPVLTLLGDTFTGRVAASLLYAVGLPELVTTSIDGYEEMALLLALEPKRLAEVKAKLLRNRLTQPLFDTRRYTRALEKAYIAMLERQQSGLGPEELVIES